jgi:YegS/Rv2252/BmrU family lipid kinase
VQAALREEGMAVRTERSRDLAHARELAGNAAAAGDPVLVLAGDGTAGALAGALRAVPGAVLGVLPGGRGNDLCRALGVPLRPAEAARALARGVERDLDVGEVDGTTFLGVASIGIDAVAAAIAHDAPAILGAATYGYAALRALAGWRSARFAVELDGAGPRAFSGYFVAAANGQGFGGGMRIAPGARLDDGLLDVVLAADLPKLRFLRLLPTVFRGNHVHAPEIDVVRTPTLRVESDRPFVVFADGEPAGRTPVTVRAVPRALRLLVPA